LFTKLHLETFEKRPLLPDPGACPVQCEAYFTGVVKIFAFLGLEKIEHFSKLSPV